ncbi:MAG: cyclic nucleotide-binding domain-containing protein [Candidatus Anammoxibacter sp.]
MITDLGKKYDNNEIIFKEGDVGDSMFMIEAGKVKIKKRSDKNGDITIAVLEAGEIFGEMALFDKMPRSASAVTLGKTRVLRISEDMFESVIKCNQNLAIRVIVNMSKRIRLLNEKITGANERKIEALKASFNIEDISGIILKEVEKIMPSEHGSLMILNEMGTLKVSMGFGTESDSKVHLGKGEGIAGSVLKTGKVEIINDVSKDSRFKPGGLDIKCLLCVPLKHEDNIFGVINVSHTSDQGKFSVVHADKLHSLSTWASIAIQNAVSFSKLKNATDDVVEQASLFYVT